MVKHFSISCTNYIKMIQRLQSIFYLLASGAFFSTFALPFAVSNTDTAKYFEDLVYDIQDHPILLTLTCLGGAIALINIFLFNNRPLQIRLGYLVIVLGILLPAVAALLMLTDGTATATGEDISEGLGLLMPVVAIIFAVLGNRFVKKDENIVRSMDRLR